MDSIRASEIYRGTGFVLVALERMEYRQDKMKHLCQVYGQIEPIAVVVCRPDAVTALDTTGAPVAIKHLKEIITDLDGMLEPYLPTEWRE